MRSLYSYLLPFLLLVVGCQPPGQRAEQEAAAGNLPEAAKLFWKAAAGAACPDRGLYLLRRAEIQEQAGYTELSNTTIDRSIESCPDLADGYWLRAQKNQAMGNRELALADARIARDQFPEARAMYSELAMELETERAIREHAQRLIRDLQQALDPEKEIRNLPDRDSVMLTRQVPIPLTLRYQIAQRVLSPKSFDLKWEEFISYRGDPSQEDYTMVRHLDLPPMDPQLPLYYRLMLANQRLPMMFRINGAGEVSEARWVNKGPDRGMQPAMLRPEIDAAMKRRRFFEPGENGIRAPGNRWSGSDVRIIDGHPLELTYQCEAVRWAEVSGVRTLQISSEVTGEGYSAQEQFWLHPKTAVVVRRSRTASYSIETRAETVTWQEQYEVRLVSVTGTE